MVLDLHRKTFLLITGASRGIGRTMALRLAEKLVDGSIIVLLARNDNTLAGVKSDIDKATKNRYQVKTHALDLTFASVNDIENVFNTTLENRTANDFERAFIIHNAATLGDVSKLTREQHEVDIEDGIVENWSKYMHTNLFSMIGLNVEFMKRFASIEKVVVNITSLCALKPFMSMSYYCTGKAAREMYFRVLALEEAQSNTIVLNYSPGVIDTQMTEILQHNSADESLRNLYKEQRDKKTILTTEQTTQKFIDILEQRNFQTGDHIDYHD